MSPAVALTSKMPSSMVRRDTSKAPPLGIEDENIAFAADLLVETIGDGAAGSLMIHRTFVPETVPVCGDSNNCIVARCAEVRLCGLLHFQEDHGRDFFE